MDYCSEGNEMRKKQENAERKTRKKRKKNEDKETTTNNKRKKTEKRNKGDRILLAVHWSELNGNSTRLHKTNFI
jgi:kynurenine formamidase